MVHHLVLALVATLAGPQAAQLTTPPAAAPAATPAPKPPAPAFKPGMPVIDRTGARAGVIQTITEAPEGQNVVVEIDGKLVGVPPSTLRLQDQGAISAQTKAEILASAGAPPTGGSARR